MVKVTNGVNIFEVTRGAYDSIYRHMGYQLIQSEKPDVFMDDEEQEDVKSADEIFAEELGKKPISQWSKDEVKRYASVKHIDLSGTRSVNDAKDVIRNAMSEEE